MANHFDPVLILAGLARLHVGGAFEHLEENRDVVSLGILAIAVRVDFEPPSDPVGDELGRVNRVF